MKNLALIIPACLFSCQVMAQNGLKEGAIAPGFVARDNSGKVINLKMLLKSHKVVVLFFYRG